MEPQLGPEDSSYGRSLGENEGSQLVLGSAASARSNNPNNLPDHQQFYWSSVLLIVGVPVMGDFLFGLDIGLTSFAVHPWSTAAGGASWWIGWLVSATAFGAFLACFVLFYWANGVGRRQELRIASLCFLFGGFLQVVSSSIRHSLLGRGVVLMVLMLGRWLYGVGVAFALHGATTYVGEMAPSSLLGPLMTCNEISLLAGLLSGYIVGSFWQLKDDSWGTLWILSLFVSSVMVYLSWNVIPESFRWLQYHNRHEEAQQSLGFLYKDGSTPADESDDAPGRGQQFLLLQSDTPSHHHVNGPPALQNSHHQTQPGRSAAFRDLLDPKYRRALIAAIGTVAFLQLTGQPTVLAYAAPLLEQAGLPGKSAVWVGLFKASMSLVAMSTVERQGRQKLLLLGTSVMLAALFVLAYASANSSSPALVLCSMFAYIGGYQIGFGTMVWLITSEVIPMAIRGPAVALAVQTNFGLHALVELLVPVVLRQTWFGFENGLPLLFGLFAFNTTLALSFVKLFVPETKGLTLEEIEEKLTRPVTTVRRDEGELA